MSDVKKAIKVASDLVIGAAAMVVAGKVVDAGIDLSKRGLQAAKRKLAERRERKSTEPRNVTPEE
jgi:hypothetical protein